MIQRHSAEPVIKVLRSLTDDGKLSGEDVWFLANWLNDQAPEILEAWPAKELVKVLNAAYEDSKLSESEMVELGETILAIEELWIEYASQVEDDPHTEGGDAHPAPSHEKASLPIIDFQTSVEGDAEADSYFVNLQDHTCSCADWRENRRDFAEGDYRRCCSHVAMAYSHLSERDHSALDPMFAAFVQEHRNRSKGAPVDFIWHTCSFEGGRVLFGASPAGEWVNLFIPTEGKYERFGYHRREHRWAYGEAPKGFTRQIRALFATPA